jgi:hypothetical protein
MEIWTVIKSDLETILMEDDIRHNSPDGIRLPPIRERASQQMDFLPPLVFMCAPDGK